MKIGVLCNMNNMAFQLVRYLRDLRYDAELVLLDDEAAHFHPSCDSFDLSYQDFTRTVAWGSPHGFSYVSPQRVKKDLDRYDQIWGSGALPAFASRAGRTLDVFVPYGSDLAGFTRFPAIPLQRRYVKSFFELPVWQRRGIRSSRNLAMDRAPVFDDVVEKLGFRGRRLTDSVPLLYLPLYDSFESYRDRSFWSPTFEKIRKESDIVVFHHARHVWQQGSSPPARKGNDVLLRAFARFAKETSARVKLVTTEYGPDAIASRELAESLGVADKIQWMPILPRRDIMVGLGYADLATGDFAVGWASGGVVFESLAAGKPLIHFRDESRLDASTLAPIINARTEDQILQAFRDYVSRPEEFRARGIRGKEWLSKNSGQEQVRRIAEAAQARA